MTHESGTLQEFVWDELQGASERFDLSAIVESLEGVGLSIAHKLHGDDGEDTVGYVDTKNVHDEQQAKLDVISNKLCIEGLREAGLFAALASEEEKTTVDLHNPDGKYVVAFDPLDGSSNIDVNGGVGTIFSVLPKLSDVSAGSEEHFLQTGRKQVLAGYISYGFKTHLVLSWGNGVHVATLDTITDKFIMQTEKLRIPDGCAYYSVNEAYTPLMTEADRRLLEGIHDRGEKLRYDGCLVTDINRIIRKGGVFFFPASESAPGANDHRPKLRQQYEAKPIAMIVEQAGGAALSGAVTTMDLVPTSLHEKVPLLAGNRAIIEALTKV